MADEEEEAADEDRKTCVPLWALAAVVFLTINFMIAVVGYGNLNTAIERDVDQDVAEINLRLTYSETYVPNWLLNQMMCLERLDGRAFFLLFNIIPSIEMGRTMVSTFFTAAIFIGTSLLSERKNVASELLCVPRG